MPLWLFPVRLAVYRAPAWLPPRPPNRHTPCVAYPPPRRSYGAALHGNRIDEQPPDAQGLGIGLPDDIGSVGTDSLSQVDPALAYSIAKESTIKHSDKPVKSFSSPHRKTRSGDHTGFQKAIQADFVSGALSQLENHSLSEVWVRNFVLIRRQQDPRVLQDERCKSLPVLHARTAEWVEALLETLQEDENTLAMEKLAVRFKVDAEYIWLNACLWFLAYDPGSVIRFLLASNKKPFPAVGFVMDSLWYLTYYYDRAIDREPSLTPNKIAEAFCILAERNAKAQFDDHGGFVRFLIKKCSPKVVQQVHRTVGEQDAKLHYHTWLQFATHFAKNDDFEQALESLQRAKDLGAAVNEYAFLSNCSTLLRRSMSQPDGLRVCMRLVDYLIGLGVRPNAPIRDIIMLNAVDAGDARTAFSVHQSLMSEGVTPTDKTFHILLLACQIDLDDKDTLNLTIRSAIEHGSVRQSPLVADTILHTLALHHTKHHPTTAYKTLVDAYSEIFDPQPLQNLGLAWSNPKSSPNIGYSLMAPTRYAMVIMIRAYVSHVILNNGDPGVLYPVYKRWRELVEAGDPLYACLADSEHMANAFLIAFITNRRTLLYATQVMRDMQRPLEPLAGVKQALPTVKSWSIFLHGFARHGQTRLAEQVLAYMRRSGIEPNLVSWNSLVHGYARAQDVPGVCDTLRRLDQSGVAWDEWTEGGLRSLKDRLRLQEALAKANFQPNVDFSSELKRGLSKRLGDASMFEDSTSTASGETQHSGSVDSLNEGTLGAGRSKASSREEGAYDPGSESEFTGQFADSPADLDDQSKR